MPSDGSFSAGRSIDSVAEIDERVFFTWNDGIFLVHGTYGIDTQFVRTLDSAVPAEERDTDRSDAFPVHGDLMVDYLAGICQDEVVKGDLEFLSSASFFFFRRSG